MVCGADSEEPLTLSESMSNPTCKYRTELTSPLGCSVFSTNALWSWLQEYYWLWGAIFIIIGLFLAFFGHQIFSVTLFIIGTLVTVAVIWLLFYTTFLTENTKTWVGWVVLSCSILVGLLFGFVLYKCQRLGASIIAGFGGYLLGVLLYTTAFWAT